METISNITSNVTNRARLGLTLVGIITAILCSLTFLQHVRNEKPSLPEFVSAQKNPQILSIDFYMEIKKVATILTPR